MTSGRGPGPTFSASATTTIDRRRRNGPIASTGSRCYSHSDYNREDPISDAHARLPLKPVELLILTVLAGGNRHGYGIRQDILDQSDGRIQVEAGNLYRHLRSLEDDGLVTEAPPPTRDGDQRRIYYRLTSMGNRVLAAEMYRLRELVRRAESQGLLTPSRA